MNKILALVAALFICSAASAKKVKFAVDMRGNIINSTGIHAFGDFQTLAGFPGGDWTPNTTLLMKETIDTNIYSIVVDLPAFAKYEYKFLNGDQSYEAEFVPVESRVGYNFDDNRWLYVDSIANDTTFVGAIRFAQNAPLGLTLVRFLTDLQSQPSVSSAGVHVAGNFQGWDPAVTILYSFVPNIYEVISYVTAGTYEYKFYNGNVTGTAETIPLTCAVNNNRQVPVAIDTVLPVVCFSGCSSCLATGIEDNSASEGMKLFPNPARGFSILEFGDFKGAHHVTVTDMTGRTVRTYVHSSTASLKIDRNDLESGLYFVTAKSGDDSKTTLKLIIE